MKNVARRTSCVSRKPITLGLSGNVCLMVLIGCGGNVSVEENSAPPCGTSEPDSAPPDAVPPDAEPVCEDWQRDDELRQLILNDWPVNRTGGLALYQGRLHVTVSSDLGSALARKTDPGWELINLPPTATTGKTLRVMQEQLVMLGADSQDRPALYHWRQEQWGEISTAPPWAKINDLLPMGDALLMLAEHESGEHRLVIREQTTVTEYALPAQPADYRVNRLWPVDETHLLVTGSLLDEYHAATQGLLFIFNLDDQTWDSAQIPASCRDIHQVRGADLNDLWVSGQFADEHAAVWRVRQLQDWRAFVNHNAKGYSPLLVNQQNQVMTAGYSIPHLTDLYGDYTNLWVTHLEESLSYNAKESFFTEQTSLLEEVSGYPMEMLYDAEQEIAYLLTTRDLYARRCAF